MYNNVQLLYFMIMRIHDTPYRYMSSLSTGSATESTVYSNVYRVADDSACRSIVNNNIELLNSIIK